MFRSIFLRSTTVLLLSTIFCLSTAYGQQRFSAGPRVGVNLSTFRGDVTGYSLSPGLVAGGFLMYSSLNHFGISGDLLYSQRGGKFEGNDRGTPLSFRQRVDYLEIPIALRYFLTLSGNFRPNLFFGPSVAIPLGAKRVNQKFGNVAQPNVDNGAAFKNADLGLFAGFQLNFRGLGDRQRFLIDARYTYGLNGITTQPIAGGLSAQRITNSTITLTLGYGFGVGPEYRSRYTAPARR